MPPLFTEATRTATLDVLLAHARSSPSTLGMLLVGSGAVGFGDQYSDIDIVYVMEPHDYDAVLAETATWVGTALHPIFSTTYRHRQDVVVHCLLLAQYLEVDLGIWSTASLFASSPRWKVVQQRDAAAGQRLEAALRHNPRLRREHEPIMTGDNPLWQFLYGAVIAQLRADTEQAERYQHQVEAQLRTLQWSRERLIDAINTIYSEAQVQALLPLLDHYQSTQQ